MRADADFMVFVAARWPSLVKEAVLLGARPEDAADATVDALSRCRRDWGRASREENVDALVQAELLLAVRRRPRTSEDGREQQARELLVLAPPTLQELEHQESVNNRANLRRAALVAVPLLLVGIGAAVYLGTTRDDGKPAADDGVLENAAISQEANPAPGVAWYADGQLHLDHTVLCRRGAQGHDQDRDRSRLRRRRGPRGLRRGRRQPGGARPQGPRRPGGGHRRDRLGRLGRDRRATGRGW